MKVRSSLVPTLHLSRGLYKGKLETGVGKRTVLTPLTQRSHDTNEQKNHNELDGVLDDVSDGDTLYPMSTLSSQNLTDIGVGNSPGNLGNTEEKPAPRRPTTE